MKKSDKRQKEAASTMEKLKGITRHIRNVQDNGLLLGEKLINVGEIELGRGLIANVFIHDASKFKGIEFEFLTLGDSTAENKKLKLKMAIHHHNTTNLHHVEAWAGGMSYMPDVYLAELVCDIKSRSEEFGTSLLDYIHEVGMKRWGISKDDETYKKMMFFVNLLCEKPFTEIK